MNGATLKQVEKLKYLGVAFTSNGRQDEELDTQIGKAGAVMRALHNSVAGPQRENFSGGTEVDTGPQIFLGPQALSGPMPLNHFLSDGCRSSFKGEGITIFAYS